MSLVFTGLALYVIYRVSTFNGDIKRPPPRVVDLEMLALRREAHKFSGIDPTAYERFTRELDRAANLIRDPHESSRALYAAIDALQDLGLDDRYEVQGDVTALAHKIGIAFEQRIFDQALLEKKMFAPRYLNRRVTE